MLIRFGGVVKYILQSGIQFVEMFNNEEPHSA